MTTTTKRAAIESLVDYFKRNGCLRRPDPKRRKTEPGSYKMGYEIRLVAMTKQELAEIRRLIRRAELKPGTPYANVNRWVQPIYGRDAMDRFVGWLEELGDSEIGATDPRRRKTSVPAETANPAGG